MTSSLHAVQEPISGDSSCYCVLPEQAEQDNLKEWLNSILFVAAKTISDPLQTVLQKRTDVWSQSSNAPYPELADITVLENSCMVFDVLAGNGFPKGMHKIHFSIWLTIGEVRIGAKIPLELADSAVIQQKISESYDGLSCSRRAETGRMTFFDWIFKDGFADFHAMRDALRDPLYGAILGRRIGEIVTHLYANILSTLQEHGHPLVMHKPFAIGNNDTACLVGVKGNAKAFELLAKENQAEVVLYDAGHPSKQVYWIVGEDLFFLRQEQAEFSIEPPNLV